jgi:hypothetical protein
MLSRRTFLRGAAGVAIGLPLLEAMGCSWRRTGASSRTYALSGAPKRLVIFFSPDGVNPPDWWPQGSQTSFTLSRTMAPLAAHQQDLLILKGVDMTSVDHDPSGVDSGHQKPMGHMLTGTAVYAQGGVVAGGGISVDQAIANQIGAGTKLGSLELGVMTFSGNTILKRMCYAGPNQPLPPENNPSNAFARVFGDFSSDPTAMDQLRAERKSVLDAVLGNYNTLRAKLGAADQKKVDAHLSSIRDVENRLTALTAAACSKPTVGTFSTGQIGEDAYPNNALFGPVGQAHMDILAMALACDLTRVASLQWSVSASATTFAWLGAPAASDEEHPLSHVVGSPAMTQIQTWYAQQFAYLIQKLKSIPEGTGTVFDNTVLLWCNCLGEGWDHTTTDIPFVIAGSAGGYFRTGRFVTYDHAPHNNLHVSLMNAMGVAATTFGDPRYCTGPLPNLT